MIEVMLIGLGFILGLSANYLFRINRKVYTNRIPDFKYTTIPPESTGLSRGSKVKNMDVKPKTQSKTNDYHPPKTGRPNTTTSIKVTWI